MVGKMMDMMIVIMLMKEIVVEINKIRICII